MLTLKFKINDTDLLNNVNEYITINELKDKQSAYQYSVLFERGLQKCKSHKVYLDFEYDVPISDPTQIFRTSYPCRSVKHEIILKGDTSNWDIQGTAFTAFYLKENNQHGFSVKKKSNNTILEINLNDWCIPGAGYMIYLNKKK